VITEHKLYKYALSFIFMPSVYITTDNKENIKSIEQNYVGLSQIIAKELTCSSRTVDQTHIRIKTLVNTSSFQSPNTTIEMFAQNYEERAKREMSICDNVRKYLLDNCPSAGSVDVFLNLVEVGYSVTKLK
jgi:hypothetical protein